MKPSPDAQSGKPLIVQRDRTVLLDLHVEGAEEVRVGLSRFAEPLPISSDAIESLFGVAKRHGVGQTQDAARIALRLPAFCGPPTREEAEQVLAISVARQHEITGHLTSLTKQRRKVLGQGKDLESLGQGQGAPHVDYLVTSEFATSKATSRSSKGTSRPPIF